jgi:hypothetical protein
LDLANGIPSRHNRAQWVRSFRTPGPLPDVPHEQHHKPAYFQIRLQMVHSPELQNQQIRRWSETSLDEHDRWYAVKHKLSLKKIFNFIIISVSFTLPEDTLWFKANVNQSGFYRVNYDREMWGHLISAMVNNSNAFSPADRASLIDDAFTLCRWVHQNFNSNMRH